ncbi:MAG: aspartate dehydrogenase [Methanobacteriota archaeon]
MKVGLIGCGAIGTALAHSIEEGKAGKVRLGWVYDVKRESCEGLVKKLKTKPKIARGISEICDDKTTDIIIEAASQSAVGQYSLKAIKSGKDIMIISVGALADNRLLKSLRTEAERKGRKIYVPSGAIVGMDGVKSSELGGIQEAVLTTRKPPAAFQDNEYIANNKIKLIGLKGPKVIFDGTAREAVKAFPASVNVAATLSLAGVGFDRTKVRVIADPKVTRNIHEIRVRGKSGELKMESRNMPFPGVPRTSYLAALSVIRTLKNLSDTIHVGT